MTMTIALVVLVLVLAGISGGHANLLALLVAAVSLGILYARGSR